MRLLKTISADLWIAASLSAVFGFAIYYYGLAFSPDSSSYLAYAQEMHYSGDYSVPAKWPPLYPFLIHLFTYLIPFPAEAAALLSGVCISFSYILFVLILRQFSDNSIANIAYLLAYAALAPMIYIYKYVWSEVPFTLFLIGNVYFIVKHLKDGRVQSLLLAGIFAALGSLTRYAGFTILAAFSLYLVWHAFGYRVDKSSSGKNAVWASLVAYLPIALYLVRNKSVYGFFLKPRPPATITVQENLELTTQVISSDLNIAISLLFAFSFAIFVYLWTLCKDSEDWVSRITFAYLAIFLLFYVSLIILTASLYIVDEINTRYFAPIYFAVFIMIFASLNHFMDYTSLIFKAGENSGKSLVLFISGSLLLLGGLPIFFSSPSIISNPLLNAGSHIEFGFNHSDTIAKIHGALRNLFEEEDQIYLTVLYKARANRYRQSATFFQRQAIFFPEMSGIRFVNVGEWDYQIEFSYKEKSKRLVYINLLPFEDIELFENSIRALLFDESIPSLFVIVHKNSMAIIDDLDSRVNGSLIISLQQLVDEYTIYKLAIEQP